MANYRDICPPVYHLWALNAYEQNRVPSKLLDDDTEVVVDLKQLEGEVYCPICLDFLKTTMTAKDCLHRFCHVRIVLFLTLIEINNLLHLLMS